MAILGLLVTPRPKYLLPARSAAASCNKSAFCFSFKADATKHVGCGPRVRFFIFNLQEPLCHLSSGLAGRKARGRLSLLPLSSRGCMDLGGMPGISQLPPSSRGCIDLGGMPGISQLPLSSRGCIELGNMPFWLEQTNGCHAGGKIAGANRLGQLVPSPRGTRVPELASLRSLLVWGFRGEGAACCGPPEADAAKEAARTVSKSGPSHMSKGTASFTRPALTLAGGQWPPPPGRTSVWTLKANDYHGSLKQPRIDITRN
jgi:hypothetical protein